MAPSPYLLNCFANGSVLNDEWHNTYIGFLLTMCNLFAFYPRVGQLLARSALSITSAVLCMSSSVNAPLSCTVSKLLNVSQNFLHRPIDYIFSLNKRSTLRRIRDRFTDTLNDGVCQVNRRSPSFISVTLSRGLTRRSTQLEQ